MIFLRPTDKNYRVCSENYRPRRILFFFDNIKTGSRTLVRMDFDRKRISIFEVFPLTFKFKPI